MQTDPKQQRKYTNLCAALIYRNHSLLSYVSALGIHQELNGALLNSVLIDYAESMCKALNEAMVELSGNTIDSPIELASLSTKPELDPADPTDQRTELIMQEMIHIGIMTTEILKLSRLLKPLIQNR